MARDLNALQIALDHRFTDPALLARALTHRSREGRPSYERLEFLGDRVLGLVVAEMLYARFPTEDEGALARRHASLVRQDTVARVAQSVGLGELMELSRGEEELGGQFNPSLLCDVCEAVLGALHLDGGYAKAQRFVEARWAPLMAEDLTPPKDAKTALQEWAQGRGLPLPTYAVEGRDGPPHKPMFTVSVTVKDNGSESALGASKRLAEQAAAQRLLDRLA
ncbi:ribonuclease III [Rhodospirillum rubrum]|uniref:Ribonuclease 3 n=1 Tax=Rhodospirillum rubrum (strain ATCC 11170 / ATH 1.1.1 / DSM 467 / LMG 4362 / NCIMB 8255 / S1) TaxID=269796 RepID=Q2RT93_RHORT|nr:ribonuclease III [Rhodospirillum rubrum]ABC22652.1 RNAse III [Rhodospirillum rubrum ATCC 11170]AEO48370.1 RNAse III [Rhodospirillum rubrum F11]MBK5954249.1 ribonuclease III [Rhodospirillum rubrum]QXG82274.1 ribonuclease III [Rhodospirillum rubrum]HCF18474.1 ribonuclease III [Rhodospirillum rubrum]